MKSCGVCIVVCSLFAGPFHNGLVAQDSINSKAKIDAQWLQKNIAGLGPSIPDDIVELHSRIKPLLDEGIGPEKVEIGKMNANRWHFIAIRFVNMFDRGIRVSNISSSCGCLVAGNTNELVGSQSEGFVIAVIKPQPRPEVYRKSLTITFDNGLIWPVMISGIFEAEVEFDQETVKIEPLTQEVNLTLTRKFGKRELASLTLESQNGNIICRKTELIDRDRVKATFSVASETRRSPFALSEQVIVRDKNSGEVVCELIVGIDIESGIQCRPRRILMKKAGDKFQGQFYLLGDLESYKRDLNCEVTNNMGDPITCSIASIGRSGAEIVLTVNSEHAPKSREEVKDIRVLINRQLVCEDLKISFLEE